MWEKYKIGETFKIIDPETKAPAKKNPFFHPKPGVLLVEDMAIDRLLAKGVVFSGCNVALQVQSKMLASNAGVSAEEAAKEWTANVIPGYASATGNLRLYMAQLRRKLEPDPARPRWLITEPGMGYRFEPSP